MHAKAGIGSSWPQYVLGRDNQGEELSVEGRGRYPVYASSVIRTPLR